MENKTFAVVGFGRVGGAFYRELIRAGYHPGVLIDRNPSNQKRIKKIIKSHPDISIHHADIKRCPWIVLSVQDRFIQQAAGELFERCNFHPDALVFHTSGSNPLSALDILHQAGVITGCLHPFLSFPDVHHRGPSFSSAFFGLTAGAPARSRLIDLVNAFHGRLIEIEDSQRILYHLAAVFASNFSPVLLTWASALLNSVTNNSSTSWEAVASILESMLHNFKRARPSRAISGPVARGDLPTIERHLQELQQNFPALIDPYILFSRNIIRLIDQPDNDAFTEISELLSSFNRNHDI